MGVTWVNTWVKNEHLTQQLNKYRGYRVKYDSPASKYNQKHSQILIAYSYDAVLTHFFLVNNLISEPISDYKF